ncbi:hypothetical protein ABPG75_008193 [Micractinium tetrahymenae]
MAPRPGTRRFGRSGGGGSGGWAAAAGFAAGLAVCSLLLMALRHREVVIATSSSRTLPGTLPPPALSAGSTSRGASSSWVTDAQAAGASRGETAGGASATASGSSSSGSSAAAGAQALAAAPRHRRDELDLDLDSLPHLFISFGNAAYFPFVHNWARSVEAIGAPYFVAAFDEAMLDLCVEQDLRCISAKFASGKYFRGDFAAFRAMGAHKVRLVLRLLEDHPRLPLVVVADSDTTWLREPWTYFEQRPGAEFFISSDCISAEMEDRWAADNPKASCGHIPGNAGVAFNTGLFAARNTPAARAFLAAWADMLTDKDRERDRERGVDDQLALNLLFEEGGIVGAGKDDPRTILVWRRQLRVQVLPVLLFSGGHVAFIQRTPWRRGIQPIYVHMTFQRWWEAGKVARLREFGLWHTDPPGYYGSGAAGRDSSGADGLPDIGVAPYGQAGLASKFLAYQNGVLQFVAELERQRGAPVVLFEKNWVGLAYQLAALRDALAVGRMLGRAVVVPPLWCWCDYDEAPGILETCINPNADYEAPFQCPMDYLGPQHVLDERYQYVQYRNPGFLDLPQVPLLVRHSRAAVRILQQKPAVPFPDPAHTVGDGVAVWQGIQQGELLRALEPIQEAAVLDFRGPMPGLVGGFDDASASAEFDDFWGAFQHDANWCCTTWGDADEEYRAFPLARSAPMADCWRPWQPPRLLAPDWCDKVSSKHGNAEFTKLPHHPCAFAPRPNATQTTAQASTL